MEIRVLRYFLTVAQEENINRAAEVLHITQPTLSRQLSQLEAETGVKLFYRGPRKITLTGEGILLRRRAEEILGLVDRTKQELSEQDGRLEGRIVIGGGEMNAMETLSELIQTFHEKYPLVTFDIFTGGSRIVKEQMQKGLIDIGVLLEPVDRDKFDAVRLVSKEIWGVLMRGDDPLSRKEKITAEDFKDKSLILPVRTGMRNELTDWFGDSLQKSQILFTSNLSTNGALMVQKGMAYSLVLEGSVPFWNRDTIVFRKLSPTLVTDSVFAWKKQQVFNPAVTRFIQHIICSPGITEV